jgi:phosphatidylglycerophosphatase A
LSRLSWPETALVTLLGTGFSPIAPATVASALTCVIFWFVPRALLWPWYLLIIPSFFIGVWLSNRAIAAYEVNQDPRFKKLRRPNPKKDDPDRVVFDEFVGQWITLLAVPHHVAYFVAAFVVFRIFDILKPLGISACQKATAGWGVMLDDLLAAAYTLVVFALWQRVFG